MRSPDQWEKIFAGLPRRKDLDKRQAARRVAKLDRIAEQEGKFRPCMSCGVATSTAPGGVGRSDTILPNGQTMRLCQSCKRQDRRARARKRAKAKTPRLGEKR